MVLLAVVPAQLAMLLNAELGRFLSLRLVVVLAYTYTPIQYVHRLAHTCTCHYHEFFSFFLLCSVVVGLLPHPVLVSGPSVMSPLTAHT